MSSLLYGRSYISQRCSVPVVCHSNWTCAKPWGRRAVGQPGHFHNDHTHVDWFPELDGFDMWGQGRHEMKADARWQSIFKCEHCEGSALASFQWKSRWMETDYQSTIAPRSLQQELSMVSFLVQIVTIVPHSCRTLTVKKKVNVESRALVQSFNPIFDFSLELPTKAS